MEEHSIVSVMFLMFGTVNDKACDMAIHIGNTRGERDTNVRQ